MKFFTLTFLAVFFFAATLAAIEIEDEVLVLTKDNFKEAVAENEFLLVEICKYCFILFIGKFLELYPILSISRCISAHATEARLRLIQMLDLYTSPFRCRFQRLIPLVDNILILYLITYD